MGGFNSSHYELRAVAGRSAVSDDNVVREQRTATNDKQMIARILRLGRNVPSPSIGNTENLAVNIALGHVRAVLSDTEQCPGDRHLTPRAERFCRRIVAQGRLRNLPYSLHRMRDARKPADVLIARGISHGYRHNTKDTDQRSQQTSFQRAMLPKVSRKAHHANLQLSHSLSQGLDIPDLAEMLSDTFAQGGKCAFVEIRDFLDVLKRASENTYKDLCVNIHSQLTGNARIRFQKLMETRVVTESDFIDAPRN